MPKPNDSSVVAGNSGDNVLVGGAGNDQMYGYGGNDSLSGLGGDDTLQGHEGNDVLDGGAGNDTLYGQEGDDRIFGGAGNDVIGFGPGSDTITGGSGADRYFGSAWAWTDQSPWISTITDFEAGIDTLDLSRFDADERTAPGVIKGKSTPGNEAFRLVGSTDGVTPGDLVVTTGVDESGQTITIVSGYTDTTPGADIVIHLLGTPPIGPGDFIL